MSHVFGKGDSVSSGNSINNKEFLVVLALAFGEDGGNFVFLKIVGDALEA